MGCADPFSCEDHPGALGHARFVVAAEGSETVALGFPRDIAFDSSGLIPILTTGQRYQFLKMASCWRPVTVMALSKCGRLVLSQH